MQPQSKSIISRFGNRRRGGDSISMLQCKAASLVNIAHSRKFHEPTFQQLGVRVRKIKQNASYLWMDNVLTAANAPRNDATPGGEAKFVFENGCQQLILGTGQMGNVHLSPEAEAYFAKKGCAVLLQPTPRAIHTFNSSHAKKIGLFHVTC